MNKNSCLRLRRKSRLVTVNYTLREVVSTWFDQRSKQDEIWVFSHNSKASALSHSNILVPLTTSFRNILLSEVPYIHNLLVKYNPLPPSLSSSTPSNSNVNQLDSKTLRSWSRNHNVVCPSLSLKNCESLRNSWPMLRNCGKIVKENQLKCQNNLLLGYIPQTSNCCTQLYKHHIESFLQYETTKTISYFAAMNKVRCEADSTPQLWANSISNVIKTFEYKYCVVFVQYKISNSTS